jgi:NADPH:quinone reductase-like Zn-dependent oxidoreductase
MERLEYDTYGGPEVVHLRTFVLGEPQADEVVVRIAVASINRMDWKIRSGIMKMMTGSKFPREMGTDFAGTVEAVGARVLDLKPGDAVVGTMSIKSSGAFATRLITKRNLVVLKPEGTSFAQTATLAIPGVTARDALVSEQGEDHLRMRCVRDVSRRPSRHGNERLVNQVIEMLSYLMFRPDRLLQRSGAHAE